MLEHIMIGGRKRESDAHFLIIESNLAPPDKRKENAVSLKEDLERLFGDEDISLNFYTFLAMFGDDITIPEFYPGIDGIIQVEAPPDDFNKIEWKDIRKFTKYLRSGNEKEKVNKYIQNKDIEGIFQYIRGENLRLDNYYDPDEKDDDSTLLKMTKGFSDRLRRMIITKEVNRSLNYLIDDAGYINAGRMIAFNSFFSFIGRIKKYPVGEGFEIDCLCTSYRFNALLDLLHIMNLKNPNTSITAYKQGNLDFFDNASIPIHLGITIDDLKE
jgi:hypothetical protein